MLKRSPHSRVATYTFIVVGIIAAYIVLNSLLTIRSLSHSHGKRLTYFVTKIKIEKGSRITPSDFFPHTMFSNDAPAQAIINKSQLSGYASYDLPKGSIISSTMISSNAIKATDTSSRIIFIPTDDVLSPSISSYADLLAVDPEGFGADVIATQVHILYDLTPISTKENLHHGYYVQVDKDEALDLIHALSQGDVRFALRDNGD